MELLKVTMAGAALAAAVIAGAEDLAPMSLSSLPAPPPRITTAMVENLQGQVIGHVQNVATDPSGKPAAISVATSQGTTVVAAQAASYDESRNLVVADLAMPQVASAAH
ncbi:MAG TPA: hypothetical protein VN718_01345 [Rhizomicrobium sp.]|nr:hypothetical protein [Rhizomicrobium sp.]